VDTYGQGRASNVKFKEFLKIVHCYIGADKTQTDFLFYCFSILMIDPFTDEDLKKDDNDEYYPFSTNEGKSLANKIYSGERMFPIKVARNIKSHFSSERMCEEIEEFDDTVKQNLCDDLAKYGVNSNIDEIANVVPRIFKCFIEAALSEKDTIDTGVISTSAISIEDGSATNLDTLLLIEAGNRCPKCGKSLMNSNAKGRSRKEYSVTQIFPDNLDRTQYAQFRKIFNVGNDHNSPNNLIALCASCSAEYKADLQIDEFHKMVEIKKQLQQRQKLQQLSDRLELETEIREIINAIADVKSDTEMVPLKMDALVVDKKISADDHLLLNTVKSDAVLYYRFIESAFADLDEQQSGTFDIIASQFRQMFLRLKAEKIDSPAIFDGITNWVKAKVGADNVNDMAIRIVVSFFVQNCEVFDEISE